jgi:Rrf2 family protein
MRLNTRTRYGARAMLELALHHEQGATSLAQVAAAQELSEKYLESLFSLLRAAGLVHGQRGPQGGYTLARPPAEITLRDIYAVFEGPEPFVPCTGAHAPCPRDSICVTQEVWARMHEVAMQVLEATTLADLVARSRDRALAGDMYYI